MKAALLNGFLGSLFTLFVGTRYLNLDAEDLWVCITASNLGAFVALLVTLQFEKSELFKRIPIHSTLKTWSTLSFIYLSILFALAPHLLDLQNFAVLILPLIFSTGFSIIVFGPIQDQIVRRKQQAEKNSRETKVTRENPVKPNTRGNHGI